MMMNRRDFLRKAATATAGASGLIVLSSSVVASLAESGESAINVDDIKVPGEIITSENMIDEIVDISKFADNVAKVLLSTHEPLTFHRDGDLFRVFGSVPDSMQFKQHGKYKLHGTRGMNTVGMRHRP